MPLSPEDWRRVEELFGAAPSRPASCRREYLAGARSDRPTLRQHVERLLAADE